MIAKYILPWFGGASTVWTISMLFFQAILLIGYGYSHFIVKILRTKYQPIVHGAVLLITLLFLPLAPGQYLTESVGDNPISNILTLLALVIGFPYFVLTTTSSLIQSWFGKLNPGRSPYPLYALSNLGSLVALISYPFFFEIQFLLEDQAFYWSLSMVVLVSLMLCNCVYFYFKCRGFKEDTKKEVQNNEETSPLLWFCLSSVTSILLLATSDYLSRDVASVPLLWVVPLSLYLLTFILCFESKRWYRRGVCLPVFAVAVACAILEQTGLIPLNYVVQIILYNGLMFISCMLCHGELAKLKPSVQHLTKFYLFVAIGGVSGGIFIGLLAPIIFQVPIDIHVGYLLLIILMATMTRIIPTTINQYFTFRVMCISVLAYFAMVVSYYANYVGGAVDISRNFYGTLRVVEEIEGQDRLRSLAHGTTSHGIENLNEESDGLKTKAYYGEKSGIGQALALYQNRPLNLGVIGLGIGTLADALKAGDHVDFYEINPEVTVFAKKYFRYLDSAKGTVDIHHGDGRLLLDHKESQKYEILVSDAFSGDSIPVHLLTSDAIKIYRKHLSDDGILAIHTSNNYLELRPVIYGLAYDAGMDIVEIIDAGDVTEHTKQSQWFLLTASVEKFDQMTSFSSLIPTPDDMTPIIWTDSSSNIFSVLK